MHDLNPRMPSNQVESAPVTVPVELRLAEALGLLGSAHSMAEREGRETNWAGFRNRVRKILEDNKPKNNPPVIRAEKGDNRTWKCHSCGTLNSNNDSNCYNCQTIKPVDKGVD